MAAARTTRPRTTLILLPGLDGTGRLFAPLLKALEPTFQAIVVSYPTDRKLGYDALCSLVERRLPKSPYIIVAESFSGPIALEVASRKQEGLQALVLSASFAANPRPCLAPLLSAFLGRSRHHPYMPDWVLRYFLLGPDAPAELCRTIRETIQMVKPEVIACRLQEVITYNAAAALQNCPVPIFYLNGATDRLLARRTLRTLLSIKPNMTVIDLPGPHMLLQTLPDMCAQQINAVVNSIDYHGS